MDDDNFTYSLAVSISMVKGEVGSAFSIFIGSVSSTGRGNAGGIVKPRIAIFLGSSRARLEVVGSLVGAAITSMDVHASSSEFAQALDVHG